MNQAGLIPFSKKKPIMLLKFKLDDIKFWMCWVCWVGYNISSSCLSVCMYYFVHLCRVCLAVVCLCMRREKWVNSMGWQFAIHTIWIHVIASWHGKKLDLLSRCQFEHPYVWLTSYKPISRLERFPFLSFFSFFLWKRKDA